MQHWNRMPDALKEQVFNRLEELAAVANLSMEDRIAYDKALDRYRVSRIVEEDARRAGWKQGLEEGMKEGREKGMAEGREKGLKEGLEKGMEKGMEKGLEKGMEKGMAEGMEKGMAEGMEKGMEKGMAEGMQKGKSEEKRAIVHNLKALGLTSEQIQAATGLSAREIDLL